MTDNNLRSFPGVRFRHGARRSLDDLFSVHQAIDQIRTMPFLIVLGAFLSLPAMPVAVCEAASHSIRVEAVVLPRAALRAQKELLAGPSMVVLAGTATADWILQSAPTAEAIDFRLAHPRSEAIDSDPQGLLQRRIEWDSESGTSALWILEFTAN